MKKFLSRNVAGVQMWIWLILAAILGFFFRSLWASLVFTAPALKALRDGAKEMNEKAAEFLQRMEAQKLADKTVDEQIDNAGDEAELKQILNYKEQQDDVHDPYMD